MGNSFRAQPLPTRYQAMNTPVTEDTLQIGLIYAVGIIAVSFITIIPGIRSWERIWASIRVFIALWIGAVLLICNFGSWYADSICTTTQYKAHTVPNSNQLIDATVGISIGLRGFNVTLKERENGCEGSEDYVRPFPEERINYVERFQWAPSWRQGRRDYGVFGAQIYQEYRAAKYRGMPYPITWVAEYFLLDGEQLIWYRKFRIAGWYTHIFMWLAFALYIISILLFVTNVRYGAYFMFLTGLIMLLASFSYSVLIQNDPPFRIPFPDGVLRPAFDYSFYLTICTGGLTAILGLLLLVAEQYFPRKTAAFFHHSYIEDDAIFEGEIEEEEYSDIMTRPASSIMTESAPRMRRLKNQKRASHRSSTNSRSGARRSNVFVRPMSTGSAVSINVNPGFEALTPTHEVQESTDNVELESGNSESTQMESGNVKVGSKMKVVVNLEEQIENRSYADETDQEQRRNEGKSDAMDGIDDIQAACKEKDMKEDNITNVTETDPVALIEMVEEKGPTKGIEMEMVTIQLPQEEN